MNEIFFIVVVVEINELDHHTDGVLFGRQHLYLSRYCQWSFSSALSNDLRFYLNSIDKIKDQTGKKRSPICDKNVCGKKRPL